MKQAYTAVITEQDGWFLGWIEEIPGVNCQEQSRAELIESLREALGEALEMNKHEAIAAANGSYVEERIAI